MSEQQTCRVPFDRELTCDVCGRFGAFAFDGKNLCTDCYEAHGSCCPEFGRDDVKPSEADPHGAK